MYRLMSAKTGLFHALYYVATKRVEFPPYGGKLITSWRNELRRSFIANEFNDT
jgi:hypothetical protein